MRKSKNFQWIALTGLCLIIAVTALFYVALPDNSKIDAAIPAITDMKTSLNGKAKAEGFSCTLHMIDVGQGDSILIRSDGKNILIDAGENNQGTTVVNYLKSLGIQKIDLLIATHPHSDHIGGMDTVINHFAIGKIIMEKLPNSMVPTTRTYRDVLTAISKKNLKITPAKVGNSYDFGAGKLTIIGPVAQYNDLNDTSVVCRFTYHKRSFLLTGDMQEQAEKDLLKKNVYLAADVLKVGHHGSSTSTSQAFYHKVNPCLCLISVGDGNKYGHPNKKTLRTIGTGKAKVFRTDYCGNIVVGVSKTGGLSVSCQKGGNAA